MEYDVGFTAILLFQGILDGGCVHMRFAERHSAGEAYMHFYGIVVPDASGAQVMGVVDFRLGAYDIEYPLLYVCRKRTFRKFSKALSQQVDGDLDYEGSDYDRCQRVQDGPAFSKQYCSSYAYGCTD